MFSRKEQVASDMVRDREALAAVLCSSLGRDDQPDHNLPAVWKKLRRSLEEAQKKSWRSSKEVFECYIASPRSSPRAPIPSAHHPHDGIKQRYASLPLLADWLLLISYK